MTRQVIKLEPLACASLKPVTAISDLAVLSEPVLDPHSRLLAISLGIVDEKSVGPLTVDEGKQVTAAIREGR